MNTICPQCGSEVKPAQKFCKKCGLELAAAHTPQSTQNRSYQLPPTIGSRRTILWVLLFAVLLIGITYIFTVNMVGHPQSFVDQAVQADTNTPAPTATPSATPTLVFDTPMGKILQPGQLWHRNGLSLHLLAWDGDQVATFAIHNDTGDSLLLDELVIELAGLAPNGEAASDSIVIYDPELSGILQAGAETQFQLVINIDKQQRAEWEYFLLSIQEFSEIKGARWELPIVNTPTNTPTPGPTFTPTPTSTPTPTATPTDTPTPHPTTIPGTILADGETWYEDGLALGFKMVESDANQIRFDLYIVSQSDKSLSGSFKPGQIIMIDNLGNRAEVRATALRNQFLHPGIKVQGNFTINPGERIYLASNASVSVNLSNQSVSDVMVEVTNLSVIEQARWKIQISQE